MTASIAVGTGLLFLVMTVAQWAAVCKAYSPSSASGRDTASTEPECNAPPHSNPNNVRVNLTDEQWQELQLEGRCYLACVTEQYQDATVMNSNISSYWPFRVSANESDCSIFGRIHECIRGCVKRSISTTRACSRLCRSSCTDECGGQGLCENPDMRDPWNHPNCSVTCHNNAFDPLNPCNLGCKVTAQLNEGAISPRDPIGPPLLIPDTTTKRAGLFTLDLSVAAPQFGAGEGYGGAGDNQTVGPTEAEIPPGPVVFLFRIEEGTSQNISYIWVSNPLAHLDLADYACQDLLVSFAVGNKEAALSNFSPKTNVTVNIGVERSIPNPPIDLQISDDIDTRVGFFGHAILNISWQRPQNSAFLENFTVSIILSPIMDDTATVCGSDSLNITISSNETYILVEAESRFSLPVINCSYRIDVYSVGPDGYSEPLSSDGPYNIETVFRRDYIGFECERIWDSENFWFSFKYIWDLPPYIHDDNVIIGSTLIPKWLDSSPSQRTPVRSNDMMASRFVFFPFEQDDSGVVSYILDANNTDAYAGPRGVEYHRPRPADSNLMYLFEANVTWNTSNIPYVPPRLTSLGFDYECSLSTLSPPPSPVTNLELESYNIRQFDITLVLRWSPPSFPNGLLAPYDVCVGNTPLRPMQESELGNDLLASMHYCGTIDEDSNGTVKLSYLDRGDSEDLYIQMRAHNMFVPGNWSDPVIISRDCGSPSVSSDRGVIIEPFSSTMFNATIVFHCEEGLLPDTVIEAVCGSTGVWSPNPANQICVDQSSAFCTSAPTVPTGAHISDQSTGFYPEGTDITLQCDDVSQAEPLTTVCHADGCWRPPPSELDCTTATSESANVKKVLSCSSQTILATVICSFVFFFLGNFIGVLCHRWGKIFIKPCTKCSNGKRREHPSPTDTPADDAAVVYEEITTDLYSRQNIELEENVAYAPC